MLPTCLIYLVHLPHCCPKTAENTSMSLGDDPHHTFMYSWAERIVFRKNKQASDWEPRTGRDRLTIFSLNIFMRFVDYNKTCRIMPAVSFQIKCTWTKRVVVISNCQCWTFCWQKGASGPFSKVKTCLHSFQKFNFSQFHCLYQLLNKLMTK